ncbi:MAG: hypothetical protein U9R25_17370 [Chloroflexota bacterium]|nr:hypothetical protein [Chloroflexota bacterium]
MRSFLLNITLLLMGIAAVAAMVWLVVGPEPPTPQNLALLLVLIIPAATGLLAPFLGWLHRRMPIGGSPPTTTAAIRQGFLVGVGMALMGGLQLAGLLDPTLILGIMALIVLTEALLQSRSRS